LCSKRATLKYCNEGEAIGSLKSAINEDRNGEINILDSPEYKNDEWSEGETMVYRLVVWETTGNKVISHKLPKL
jgi:hypothetical protein